MSAANSGVVTSTCGNCGKLRHNVLATGTCAHNVNYAKVCDCSSTDLFDYKEPPVKISNVAEYLKYKKESLPSKTKRLKNRTKRRKRR